MAKTEPIVFNSIHEMLSFTTAPVEPYILKEVEPEKPKKTAKKKGVKKDEKDPAD